METSVSGGALGRTPWRGAGRVSGGRGGSSPLPSSLTLSSLAWPQTIKKTRFPYWDEVLELQETPGAPAPLRVELWDWDMVGKNDFLGMVSVLPRATFPVPSL